LADNSPVREILEQVIRTLITRIKELQHQIRSVVSRVMPGLLELPGVSAIVVGTLLAGTGDPQRFPSPDHFASYCGAAPVERGSGQNTRMQINPGGHRRLNWALQVIAIYPTVLSIEAGGSGRYWIGAGSVL
jgi:transposase